jgi:hypothetical protein
LLTSSSACVSSPHALTSPRAASLSLAGCISPRCVLRDCSSNALIVRWLSSLSGFLLVARLAVTRASSSSTESSSLFLSFSLPSFSFPSSVAISWSGQCKREAVQQRPHLTRGLGSTSSMVPVRFREVARPVFCFLQASCIGFFPILAESFISLHQCKQRSQDAFASHGRQRIRPSPLARLVSPCLSAH